MRVFETIRISASFSISVRCLHVTGIFPYHFSITSACKASTWYLRLQLSVPSCVLVLIHCWSKGQTARRRRVADWQHAKTPFPCLVSLPAAYASVRCAHGTVLFQHGEYPQQRPSRWCWCCLQKSIDHTKKFERAPARSWIARLMFSWRLHREPRPSECTHCGRWRGPLPRPKGM